MSDSEKSGDKGLRLSRLVIQFLGMLGGVLVGFVLALVFPSILDRIGLSELLTWCALFGVVSVSLQQFERAGAALTRREDPVLNYAVGFGILAVLILIVAITL